MGRLTEVRCRIASSSHARIRAKVASAARPFDQRRRSLFAKMFTPKENTIVHEEDEKTIVDKADNEKTINSAPSI
jgi:archaeosine-15-forming tRNA-guanine transglycosylase